MSNQRDGVLCPICGTWWALTLRRPGRVCRDWSQRQAKPCVGRVISAGAYDRAEWPRRER